MMATYPARPFRRRAYFYKKDSGGWKRRFFILDQWTIRYFTDQQSSNPKGCIDLSTGRGVRTREQCKVEWPPEAKPHLCFGIATETRTYYLYATDMQSIEQWMTELQKIIIEKVGCVSIDWENDIRGKPESEGSKRTRGVAQIASRFAKGVAESGVLSDKTSLAVKAMAGVAEGQAVAEVHTSWKERAKLGVMDGLQSLQKDEPQNGQGLTEGLMLIDESQKQQTPSQWPALTMGENSIMPAAYPGNALTYGAADKSQKQQTPSQWPALTMGENSIMSAAYPGNALTYGAAGSLAMQHQPGAYGTSWQQIAALGEDLVPFYRYWKSSKADHFYTTNIDEIGTATPGTQGRFEYNSEGIQCVIYSKPKAGTVPLFRYWSGGHVIDHFYATNAGEIGTTFKGQMGAYGYVSEGIAGYCFPTAMPGTIPLYRYYAAHAMDHLYTTNPLEIGTTIAGETGNYGYKSEGIVGYVIPYSG